MGPTLSDAVGPAQRFWTLTLWNPWFALRSSAASTSAGVDVGGLWKT
ncbi:hypothetical protein [Micromonospora luteifusca]